MSRPSRTADGPALAGVRVRMTDSEILALDSLGTRWGTTRTETIRRALALAIAEPTRSQP